MPLLEDELKMIAESKRKRRLGLVITFGILGLSLLVTSARAIFLIFFSHSW
jgi:hypothetical protein